MAKNYIDTKDVLKEMEMNVPITAADISRKMGRNRSAMKRHLERLEKAGCVKHREDGKWVKIKSEYETKNESVPTESKLPMNIPGAAITQVDTVEVLRIWLEGVLEESDLLDESDFAEDQIDATLKKIENAILGALMNGFKCVEHINKNNEYTLEDLTSINTTNAMIRALTEYHDYVFSIALEYDKRSHLRQYDSNLPASILPPS